MQEMVLRFKRERRLNGLDDVLTFGFVRIYKTAFIFICTLSLLALAGCSGGDDFKKVETSSTEATVPSRTPTLKQPCSLMTPTIAALTLNIAEKNLDPADGTPVSEEILRCKYSALSDDNELYIVLNIYVYKTQEAFDKVKEANKGKKITTEVDGGFSYVRSNKREVEYFVGAYKGRNRVGVSASIGVTDPEGSLTEDQIALPTLDTLATQVGKILAKV